MGRAARLAIWAAVVLLASGALAANGSAIDQPGHSLPPSKVSLVLPALFEVRLSCPVITVGACPMPAIPAAAPTRRATIVLCSESLCGSGFHPGETILLIAMRSEGSTFWRTRADRSGNFRSALPAPLCHFAPVSLTAFDTHAGRSNRLSLASTGCMPLTPKVRARESF
jgi:hypothetical protein